MATIADIKRFLQVGSGSGSGSGDGYGSGSGSGYGSGSGSGYGYGYGLKTYNGQKVYMIDGFQTLIYHVHGGFVEGAIIKDDLTLEHCYVAKVHDFFAHGKTINDAYNDASCKYFESAPLEDRIERFKSKFPTLDTIVDGSVLFDWHHILTGSCKFGREQFCKEHGLDPEKTRMTVTQFIQLTLNAYGGDSIKALAQSYK